MPRNVTLISVQEASEISGLTVLAIRNLVRKGRINSNYFENNKRCTYQILRYPFYKWIGWSQDQITAYEKKRANEWLRVKESAN